MIILRQKEYAATDMILKDPELKKLGKHAFKRATEGKLHKAGRKARVMTKKNDS